MAGNPYGVSLTGGRTNVPDYGVSLSGERTGGDYTSDLDLGNVGRALSITRGGSSSGGGFVGALPAIGQAAQGLAGSGDAHAQALETRGYTTSEEDGQRNQQQAASMLGSIIGAIASIYSGNVGGAVAGASSLAGGGKK